MISALTGGDLLGWFKFDDIYKFSNKIDSAVYAFGVFPEVPNKFQLPINMKNVVYIGQTGGSESTFDKKDKETGRGYLITSFHKRMKSHAAADKVKLIRENMDTSGVLCVCVITPKKYMEIKNLKRWLLHTESELVDCYGYIFGESPKYNFAHQSNRVSVDEESFSQKMVKQINENSLFKFYE